MSSELVRVAKVTGLATKADLGDLLGKAGLLADAATADNTRLAYAGAWLRFSTWCGAAGLSALPADPAAVAAYVAHLADAGKKYATVNATLAAITDAHTRAGLASPTRDPRVKDVAAGYRRTHGIAATKKAAATPDMLLTACASLGDDLTGLRNRALLLLGFAGGFRRSELVALTVADVVTERAGLVVTVRRGKTDQAGAGKAKPISYGSTLATCPVRAVQAWIAAAQLTEGPLFRDVRGNVVGTDALCDRTVARVVKAAATVAGLDPAAFAGHSLRSGLVTAAAKAGKRLEDIAAITGQTLPTLMGYIRRANLFDNAANAGIGL